MTTFDIVSLGLLVVIGLLQLGQCRGELAYICDEETSAASGNV